MSFTRQILLPESRCSNKPTMRSKDTQKPLWQKNIFWHHLVWLIAREIPSIWSIILLEIHSNSLILSFLFYLLQI